MKLTIFGANFGQNGTSITVGEKDCPILAAETNVDASYVECLLPGGDSDTLVDIVVMSYALTYTFAKGYRYIDGKGFR